MEKENNQISTIKRNKKYYKFSAIRVLDEPFGFNDLLSALDGQDAELNTPIAAEKLLKIMKFKHYGLMHGAEK